MEKARWILESKNGVLPKVGDNIYLIKPSGEIEKLDFQKNIKNITSIKGIRDYMKNPNYSVDK